MVGVCGGCVWWVCVVCSVRKRDRGSGSEI